MSATPLKEPTSGQTPTSVVVVGEFPIFSDALGAVISLEEDLRYVGSATTADEAVDLITDHSPDVIVIDVDLPTADEGGLGGIAATKLIKAARPEVRVLVLTGQMELDTMARAAADGACGFLAKNSTLKDICQAIRTAKDGGMFVESELVPSLLQRLKTTSRRPIGGGSARPALTPRQQEVLTLLGEGLDVTVIARRLGISLSTCRGHVKSLLVKLGSHSQLEAVVEAVHQGLLPHLSK